MRDYFKPLRRKLGVVTLVLACVFAVGWVRSLRLEDSTAFSVGKNTLIQLISRNRTLAIRKTYSRFQIRAIADRPDKVLLIEAEQPPPPNPRNVAYSFDEMAMAASGTPYKWDVETGGLKIGSVKDETFSLQARMWVVPYWAIVLPLTLLSAWLLLSKPERPKPTTEPPV